MVSQCGSLSVPYQPVVVRESAMQMVRCASIELRRHSVCCFALHPGTVDTDLTRAFARARAKYKVCLGGKACVVHMVADVFSQG